MKAIEQRLQALETAVPSAKVVRQFIGHEAENRYFENCNAPVNYRNGLDPSQTPGKAYTKAELVELERQGYEIQLISIVYENMSIDGNFADNFLTGDDLAKGI